MIGQNFKFLIFSSPSFNKKGLDILKVVSFMLDFTVVVGVIVLVVVVVVVKVFPRRLTIEGYF